MIIFLLHKRKSRDLQRLRTPNIIRPLIGVPYNLPPIFFWQAELVVKEAKSTPVANKQSSVEKPEPKPEPKQQPKSNSAGGAFDSLDSVRSDSLFVYTLKKNKTLLHARLASYISYLVRYPIESGFLQYEIQPRICRRSNNMGKHKYKEQSRRVL